MYDNIPYPGYTVDKWENILDDMIDAGRNLTQKDIDFICKTYQIWHDFFFGSENMETDLEQIQPFTFSATCCIDSHNTPFGGSPVTLNGVSQSVAHLVFPVVFDGFDMYTGACQPVYASPLLNQSTPENQAKLGQYMSYCNQTALGTSIICNRKNSSLTPFYNDRCLAAFPNNSSLKYIMPCTWQAYSLFEQPYYSTTGAKPYFELFDNTVVYANSSQIKTELFDTLCFDLNTVAYIDNNATPSSGYYKNFGSGLSYSSSKCNLLRPITGDYGGSITTNIPRENISDNFYNTIINNSTYNTTYNYTTNNGDTITIYYGDTFISTGTGNTPITYDDLFNILTYVTNDLDVNAHLVDSNGNSIDLKVPTFDEIKYIDYGDFEIAPLEQYRELPSAPSFDVDLDVSDLPDTIGHSVSEYLNIADTVLGVGGSALLLGALFFSFLWMKIKRR